VLWAVEELVARISEIVDTDASLKYGPFKQAGIDVRVHIPDAWFLDLRSLARAYPRT
jgi:hypothetical protein